MTLAKDRAHKLMQEFYLSPSYDPKAERPADVVQAAIEFALSTDRAPAVSEEAGWQPIETAPRDGTILELVVDCSVGDHPLNDATLSCTIGFNNFDNDDEDDWNFAGWCWTHDHFTDGKGRVVAWRPSRLNATEDALGPLPEPPARTPSEPTETTHG